MERVEIYPSRCVNICSGHATYMSAELIKFVHKGPLVHVRIYVGSVVKCPLRTLVHMLIVYKGV